MAGLKTIFSKCPILIPKVFGSTIQNGMAIYPKYYIDPVFKKEDQEELVKSGEISQYSHVPAKAVEGHKTCSPTYDPLINLFTNYLMREGNKALARELIEKSFAEVKRIQLERYHKSTTDEDRSKIELDPKVVFYNAVENCKPLLHLTPIKRGGVKYQVPVPITDRKSRFLSMNWLIQAANEKDKKLVRFWTQLAREFVDASNNSGRVVRKKQDLHRQCEANKAYAHYRWS